jgi:hypothetical protein
MKDKILNEEGKKKQQKIKELQSVAEKLNCTLAQLAIGKNLKINKNKIFSYKKVFI